MPAEAVELGAEHLRLRSLSACRSDLVPNFCDSSGAHFIEHSNHVAVHCHQARADGDLYVRIGAVNFKKARQDLIVRHKLVVKSNRRCPPVP